MLPNFIKVPFIKSCLGRIASSNDTKTTVLGVVAAAVLASEIDYGKLLNGDGGEIGKVVGVVVVALIGYYTNKHPKPAA